jgi:phage shock protein A
MGIFSRFTDIVNSNINSLLDKAEDPEKMVRLIIQEMEDTLVEVRSNSAKSIAVKKDVNRQIERNQAEINDWQNKAELALSKDREELARAALSAKHRATERNDVLQNELVLVEDQLNTLQQEVVALQDKLVDAKQRQKAILLRKETVSSRLKVQQRLDDYRGSDATDKFDRYERKIDDMESKVEAYTQTERSLADEFAELENDDNIDSELAALKAKINKK